MDWQVVVIHTKPQSLLKDIFEAAFPDGRVASLFRPGLKLGYRTRFSSGPEMIDWFKRQVYDPGIWANRVLTIYETGHHHHYTYGLSYLAARRRHLNHRARHNWTYCHFDNHRDDYEAGDRKYYGFSPYISFANFVDSLAFDHGAIPFLIGPDIYPKQDLQGYTIRGFHIPVYSNYFTGPQKKIYADRTGGLRGIFGGNEMPSVGDLEETPRDAYLSFDLDVLPQTEMVTHFDQNHYMTLRRLCEIVERVQSHKRVFGADILGLPTQRNHPLSALTMLILARKVMGLGVDTLLQYHTMAKLRQAAWLRSDPTLLTKLQRPSPISREELLEIVR